MATTTTEREAVGEALLVLEVALRRAQSMGDRVAMARWRVLMAAFELRARWLLGCPS